jgi:hypothetical protein
LFSFIDFSTKLFVFCHFNLLELRIYFFPFDGFCASALPADLLESLLVLPSVRTFEATVAALEEVTFAGALVCDRALPAAVLDFGAVLELVNIFDALEAALAPVTFGFVILVLLSRLFSFQLHRYLKFLEELKKFAIAIDMAGLLTWKIPASFSRFFNSL